MPSTLNQADTYKKIQSFGNSRNSLQVTRTTLLGVLDKTRAPLVRGEGRKALITKDFYERTTAVGIKDPFAINTIAMENTRKELKGQVLVRK